MTETDNKIYKSFLEHLKNGTAFTFSSLARGANISRKTLHNKIDEHTFQDLKKYKTIS